MNQRLRQMTTLSFVAGILVGGLLTLVVLALTLRLFAARTQLEPAPPQSGAPDLTLSLSRDLLQRLVADGLQNMSLPLVSLRDPSVQLEPDALLVVRLRGDTVLLGGQSIVLRLRIVPAASGVRVVTEAADVGGLIELPQALTARLDAQLNAELARRLTFTDEFEVLEVGGTHEAVTIHARLKE